METLKEIIEMGNEHWPVSVVSFLVSTAGMKLSLFV
jgi:hypothetical protein